VLSASFSPDGKKLVTADGDGSAKIWDAAALARRVWIVDQGAEATSVAFSPDGKWIVSGSANGTVSLWDTVNRE
jgi:WD40 repeat protein